MTTEEVLTSVCKKLLLHLVKDDSIHFDEMTISQADGDETAYMTTTKLSLPCFGETRVESLGWMIAQALHRLPVAHPLAMETHDVLTKHGIKIPSRDEFCVAIRFAEPCGDPTPPTGSGQVH